MKKLIAMIAMTATSLMAYPFELINGSLDNSEIYPGCSHTFQVSIPAGYDETVESALYLGFDGILNNDPAVIASLTARGTMPQTIGIYLQPGLVKQGDKITQHNRSNEFDAIDNRMASFIENELLPAVKAMRTPDGKPLNISSDPDLHAIAGASSGGIAAFMVAWNRPDLFHRVYTTCGTFVAMRGGDLIPALVRKTDPKPLRLVIHDGSRDAWNPLFGHWYEQNQLLASSLRFAGYDLMTKWDDGIHSIHYGAILFPEAMAYLWKDYRDGVKPGATQNDMLSHLLDGATQWQPSQPLTPAPLTLPYPNGDFMVESEPGSSWLYAFYIDNQGNKTNRRKAYLLHDTSFCDPEVTGLTFDTDGNLYAATNMGIQVLDQNGRVRAILPYPAQGQHSDFALEGDTLAICIDGKWYSRKINAQGVDPDAEPIEVKSIGAA